MASDDKGSQEPATGCAHRFQFEPAERERVSSWTLIARVQQVVDRAPARRATEPRRRTRLAIPARSEPDTVGPDDAARVTRRARDDNLDLAGVAGRRLHRSRRPRRWFARRPLRGWSRARSAAPRQQPYVRIARIRQSRPALSLVVLSISHLEVGSSCETLARAAVDARWASRLRLRWPKTNAGWPAGEQQAKPRPTSRCSEPHFPPSPALALAYAVRVRLRRCSVVARRADSVGGPSDVLTRGEGAAIAEVARTSLEQYVVGPSECR